MSKDVRSKTVDDLDISLRTHGLLKSFGASTVGDVLDLPRIIVPCDWPLKISALVGTELTELFEELGVEYAGEIVFPPLAEAKLIATGDIGARWRTIEEWLKAEHPSALAHWNKPASASAITEVEARLGQILPEEYKQFLSLHDGQRYLAPFVGLGSLLPIADVVMAKQGIFGEPGTVDEDDVGDGVRALDYCAGWIPISRSARGRDYLCIDLDPAPGGTRGQIIEYVVDSNARPLVARSFADLLSEYFTQAQTGEINFDEDDEERE